MWWDTDLVWALVRDTTPESDPMNYTCAESRAVMCRMHKVTAMSHCQAAWLADCLLTLLHIHGGPRSPMSYVLTIVGRFTSAIFPSHRIHHICACLSHIYHTSQVMTSFWLMDGGMPV